MLAICTVKKEEKAQREDSNPHLVAYASLGYLPAGLMITAHN